MLPADIPRFDVARVVPPQMVPRHVAALCDVNELLDRSPAGPTAAALGAVLRQVERAAADLAALNLPADVAAHLERAATELPPALADLMTLERRHAALVAGLAPPSPVREMMAHAARMAALAEGAPLEPYAPPPMPLPSRAPITLHVHVHLPAASDTPPTTPESDR